MTYGHTDPNLFLQRYADSQARRSEGMNKYSPEQGAVGKPFRNIFRIMPAHPNMGVEWNGAFVLDPIMPMGKIHFSLGPNGDTACPCLEPYGEPCPACNWVDQLKSRQRAAGDLGQAKQFGDLAYRLRSQVQFAANVVDMLHPERGVLPYYFGDRVEKALRACFIDDNGQFRDIAHPETGRDIIMEISTNAKDFRQYDVIRPKDSASALQDPTWLESIADLSQEVFKPSPQQVQEALGGKRPDRRAPALAAGTAPAPPAALPSAPIVPAAPAKRGPGRPPNAQAAPVPAAPPAARPMPAPPAVAPPPPAAPPRPMPAPPAAVPAPPAAPAGGGRRPMGAPAPAATVIDESPYDRAKREVAAVGVTVDPNWTPLDITPAVLKQNLADNTVPPCFTQETDPTAVECRQCAAINPCWAVKHGYTTVEAFLAT